MAIHYLPVDNSASTVEIARMLQRKGYPVFLSKALVAGRSGKIHSVGIAKGKRGKKAYVLEVGGTASTALVTLASAADLANDTFLILRCHLGVPLDVIGEIKPAL